MGEMTKQAFYDLLALLAATNYFQALTATIVINKETLNREIISESSFAKIKALKPRAESQNFLTQGESILFRIGKARFSY
jgi:hypothetical protein